MLLDYSLTLFAQNDEIGKKIRHTERIAKYPNHSNLESKANRLLYANLNAIIY